MISKLIISIVSFFGENYNDVACGLIILAAFYWFVRYDIAILSRIKNSFMRLNDEVRSIFGFSLENINKADEIFKENVHPVIKEAWIDYYGDFINKTGRDIDIHDYFNSMSMITLPASRKKVEAVPGILTAMGILGTFLGLVSGLSDVDISSEISMQGSINTLLGGAAVVFSISIIAIILSILFQILDKQLYSKTLKQLHIFCNLIEHKIPALNNNHHIELLINEHQKQTLYLHKMGNEIAGQIGSVITNELAESIKSSYEDSFKNVIGPSINNMSEMLCQLSKNFNQTQSESMQKMVDSFIDSLNKSLNGQLQTWSSTLHDLADTQLKTRESMDMYMNEMAKGAANQKEINRTSETILKTILQHHEQMLKSSAKLAETLDKANVFTDTLADVIDTNREIFQNLNEERLRIQQESNNYFDNMSEQLIHMKEDINSETEKILMKFSCMTSESFEKMEGILKHSINGVESNSKAMLEYMGENVKILGLYVEEISQRMNDLNSQLKSSVKEFNEQVHNGITKTFSNFDEGLGEICLRFSSTISEINDAIDNLPVIFGTLKDEIASSQEKER